MIELTVVFYPVRSNKESEGKNKEGNKKSESAGTGMSLGVNNVGRKTQAGIVSFAEEDQPELNTNAKRAYHSSSEDEQKSDPVKKKKAKKGKDAKDGNGLDPGKPEPRDPQVQLESLGFCFGASGVCGSNSICTECEYLHSVNREVKR